LQFIPTAALAGILVYTGFRLIDYREFARLWKHDRSEALIMVTTLAVIVGDDLLVGVVTGFVLSAIKLLVRFTRVDVRVSSVANGNGEPTVVVQIAGAATFLRLPVLAAQLDAVPQQSDVRIEINRLAYLDEACHVLLESWIQQREAEGQRVSVDRQRLDVFERDAARFTLVSPSRWWTKSLLRNPKPQ
jgi:MFS superfamily sulfate permease-like transporter